MVMMMRKGCESAKETIRLIIIVLLLCVLCGSVVYLW